MSDKQWVIIRGALGALVICGAAAEPALAVSQLGQNLGNEIKALGSALLLAIALIAGLSAFGSRDFARLAQVFVVSIGLGGFAFAPETVQTTITDLWKNIA